MRRSNRSERNKAVYLSIPVQGSTFAGVNEKSIAAQGSTFAGVNEKSIAARVLGMLLALSMVVCSVSAQTWRDVYKVKKKDTLYGIAQSYGLTVEELKAANEEMRAEGYTLKKGSMIFIPYPTAAAKHWAVGVMLPLNAGDSDSRRMVEYYRGLLLACETLRDDGISTDIYAWDVPKDGALPLAQAQKLDIIFGPRDSSQVPALAAFCKSNDIQLVIPFSTTATDVQSNDHVYQVYPSGDVLTRRAIDAFKERFRGCNVIFIDCNDPQSSKGAFTTLLRQALAEDVKITNLTTEDALFKNNFSADRLNVIVLNSASSAALAEAFRKLAVVEGRAIAMFGYTEWLTYESTFREMYHKYDVYIPSTFYYYKGLARVAAIESAYERAFGEGLLSRYIPRMALTGYDHALFFLGREYTPVQTPLRFEHYDGAQGWLNSAFELVHYKNTGIIETIAY